MGRFLSEFKAFLFKTNTLALAIAVVIGVAVTSVVTSIKDNLLMPLIGLATPGGDWRAIAVGPRGEFKIGLVVGSFLDFVIIGFVVFVLTKILIREKPSTAEPPPPTKRCPECLEEIPVAARRCRACTSVLAT
jgi:large conductance mechanosensitive channel